MLRKQKPPIPIPSEDSYPEKPKHKSVLEVVKGFQVEVLERRIAYEDELLKDKIGRVFNIEVQETSYDMALQLTYWDTEGIRFYLFPIGASGDLHLHARILAEPNLWAYIPNVSSLLTLLSKAEANGISFGLMDALIDQADDND